MTPPPGEETAAVKELIDQAKAEITSGKTVSDVLTSNTYMPVRAWPRFRELIKENAPVKSVTLTPTSESGELLHVRGMVRNAQGKPMQAMLYLYHTSAKGWYSDKAAHIGGNSGDYKHARLFTYLKTDDQGRYEFQTIRPGGYPATDLPAHIHLHINTMEGKELLGTEICFEDDPRQTPAWRKRTTEAGFLLCPVDRSGRISRVVADFQVK